MDVSLSQGVAIGERSPVGREHDGRDARLVTMKLAGTYPLPYGVNLSGSWQGYPGVPTGTARQDGEYVVANNRVPDPSVNINYNVTRTQIPNLTVASIQVPLLTPGQSYLSRWNQIDMRFSKRFDVKKMKISAQMDIFNLLNADTIASASSTYSTWLAPSAVSSEVSFCRACSGSSPGSRR